MFENVIVMIRPIRRMKKEGKRELHLHGMLIKAEIKTRASLCLSALGRQSLEAGHGCSCI